METVSPNQYHPSTALNNGVKKPKNESIVAEYLCRSFPYRLKQITFPMRISKNKQRQKTKFEESAFQAGHTSKNREVMSDNIPPPNIPTPFTKIYECWWSRVNFCINTQPAHAEVTEINAKSSGKEINPNDPIESSSAGAVAYKSGIKAANPIPSPTHFLGVITSLKQKYANNAVIKGERL